MFTISMILFTIVIVENIYSISYFISQGNIVGFILRSITTLALIGLAFSTYYVFKPEKKDDSHS